MDRQSSRRVRTYSHWGAYDVEVEGEAITAVHAYHDDPDPSPIGQSFRDAIHHRTRIARPAVRRGWLERGPENHGGGRGHHASRCLDRPAPAGQAHVDPVAFDSCPLDRGQAAAAASHEDGCKLVVGGMWIDLQPPAVRQLQPAGGEREPPWQ